MDFSFKGRRLREKYNNYWTVYNNACVQRVRNHTLLTSGNFNASERVNEKKIGIGNKPLHAHTHKQSNKTLQLLRVQGMHIFKSSLDKPAGSL